MARAFLLIVVCAAVAVAQDGLTVLRANCLACHSEKNLTSGLSLETRESILRGGNRGPAIAHGTRANGAVLTYSDGEDGI